MHSFVVFPLFLMYLTNADYVISNWPVASKPTLMGSAKWAWVLERSLHIWIIPRKRQTNILQEGNSLLSITGLQLSRRRNLQLKILLIFLSRPLPRLVFCLTHQIAVYKNASTSCFKRLWRMDFINYVVWEQTLWTWDPTATTTRSYLITYVEKSILQCNQTRVSFEFSWQLPSLR